MNKVILLSALAIVVMGLVPTYAQADPLQEWKDYVEEYKAYMENYKKWANEQINHYKDQAGQSGTDNTKPVDNTKLQALEKEIKELKADNEKLKKENQNIKKDNTNSLADKARPPPVDKAKNWVTTDKEYYKIGDTIKVTGKFTPKASYTLANGTEVLTNQYWSEWIKHDETSVYVVDAKSCQRYDDLEQIGKGTVPDLKKYWTDEYDGYDHKYIECADVDGNFSRNYEVNPDKFLYGTHTIKASGNQYIKITIIE